MREECYPEAEEALVPGSISLPARGVVFLMPVYINGEDFFLTSSCPLARPDPESLIMYDTCP